VGNDNAATAATNAISFKVHPYILDFSLAMSVGKRGSVLEAFPVEAEPL
jgi:hypothetical protein